MPLGQFERDVQTPVLPLTEHVVLGALLLLPQQVDVAPLQGLGLTGTSWLAVAGHWAAAVHTPLAPAASTHCVTPRGAQHTSFPGQKPVTTAVVLAVHLDFAPQTPPRVWHPLPLVKNELGTQHLLVDTGQS